MMSGVKQNLLLHKSDKEQILLNFKDTNRRDLMYGSTQ